MYDLSFCGGEPLQTEEREEPLLQLAHAAEAGGGGELLLACLWDGAVQLLDAAAAAAVDNQAKETILKAAIA